MDVAFVVHVFDVHAHDFAADPASLRVPTYVIANFELLSHGRTSHDEERQPALHE
jgi:hypothetical protein